MEKGNQKSNDAEKNTKVKEGASAKVMQGKK